MSGTPEPMRLRDEKFHESQVARPAPVTVTDAELATLVVRFKPSPYTRNGVPWVQADVEGVNWGVIGYTAPTVADVLIGLGNAIKAHP